MRICTKCKVSKSLDSFQKHSKRTSGLQTACKDCMREYHKNWYKNDLNKAKIRKRSKLDKEYKRRLLQRFKSIKKCFICKEDEPCSLDFHHLDSSEKEFNPSSLNNNSIASIKTEISKCVILCSNCHRKVHGGIFSLLLK